MARRLKLSLMAALALALAGSASAEVPANIAAALADKTRPAADIERDVARKPGELLAFAGVREGDHVADFIIGGGYFTRILSGAVGPKGKVFAYQPAEFIQFSAPYGENLKKVAAERANVTANSASFGAFDLPDNLDLVVTVQNYHDLHLKPFPPTAAGAINAEIFKSLKPGGVFLVVDHEAKAGAELVATADGLHRIDIEQAKKEIEAAGFKLEAESQLLDMPDDPRTASVFDPSIRGKTDQFVLKFRKPA
jgi:predicted methyltransferase